MSNLLDQTLARFNYDLPKERIANQPLAERDQSRLLVLDRQSGGFEDRQFFQLIDYLGDNDVLVLNETKVFPARMLGKKQTGGKVELLLLKQLEENAWQAIAKPGLTVGQRLFFASQQQLQLEDLDLEDLLQAQVKWRDDNSALVRVEFNRHGENLWRAIDACGITPLPPYIKNQQTEAERKAKYQTVYAKNTGSAAAPTAGLHFTAKLLTKLEAKGVQIERVSLHVGLGTFAKLSEENLKNKTLHEEFYQIEAKVAKRLLVAKKAGKRIVAVGTTSSRSLESAVFKESGQLKMKTGPQTTKIFIDPPYQFQFVDALITNFHLPQSSLLMMVSAFCSQPNSKFEFEDFQTSILGRAYLHAVADKYRFFSFGDAMLIV